jgi:uncharacterized Fe-S radical SAM superfamily protein PflX
MDFFFENDIFCQNFDINFNKIVWRMFSKFQNIFSKKIQEYSKNILGIFPPKNHKSNQEVGGCGSSYYVCNLLV